MKKPARCAATTRRPDDARGTISRRCERRRSHDGAHEAHYVRQDGQKRTMFWMV